MAKSGTKSVFVCSECGNESAKWFGKCPACGAWNTMFEQKIEIATVAKGAKPSRSLGFGGCEQANPINHLEDSDEQRFDTGCGEFNRVLGGGLVKGSVCLISGEPGIGKSTLLLQISSDISKDHKVLYVSGEESKNQIKLRANRLGIKSDKLFILTETNVEDVLQQIDAVSPDVVIVDSIQTMYDERVNSTPSSITQVKECTMSLINKAKATGIATLIVGHVNKEGSIAGPKVVEHMVDAVLHFEGERSQQNRIIRAEKNRFGSTNEIGVFEMTDEGLKEVKNPSEMLLLGRPIGVPGNCTVCIVEGSRPLLAEIQALVSSTIFPSPRRMTSGIDYNRLSLIIAVLEKRLGLKFSNYDAYLNVVGGIRIDEPASDLAIALALYSGITDIPIPDQLAVIGEIGLAGECRPVNFCDLCVSEAARQGFAEIMIPIRNYEKLPKTDYGIKIVPVKGLYDAINYIKNNKEK